MRRTMNQGGAPVLHARHARHARHTLAALLPVLGLLAGAAAPARASAKADAPAMSLKGGESVTAFGSLTVEGEDRIHVEFERPALILGLDPETAPGLDWGSPADVLERSAPDPGRPYLASTAVERSPYLGRPWLRQFAAGSVATFRPAVTDVARWGLSIADSRGEVVASFSGQGQPPREIVWDGRSARGGHVVPGRVYSSVFEAYDRAGNKRSMVGQGFQVGAIRIPSATGMVFLFQASAIGDHGPLHGPSSPLLLEAASWINQLPRAGDPVRITGIARMPEAGETLAQAVRQALAPQILGGEARIQATSLVEADAAPEGTVRIEAGGIAQVRKVAAGAR